MNEAREDDSLYIKFKYFRKANAPVSRNFIIDHDHISQDLAIYN